MNNPAYISIILGVLIIVSRGPLIFRPEATREFYLKMFATKTRVRVVGLVVLALGCTMVFSVREAPGAASVFFAGLGYLFGAMAFLLLLAFPSFFKLIFEAFFEAADNVILRGLGVLAVGVGAFFIWLGFRLMV
jgi:uncharacterized protein YjeT (DUF2065 family)